MTRVYSDAHSLSTWCEAQHKKNTWKPNRWILPELKVQGHVTTLHVNIPLRRSVLLVMSWSVGFVCFKMLFPCLSVCLSDLLFIFRPRPARWQWRLVMALLDWRLKLAKLWPHHSLKRRSGSDFYEIKQKLFSRIRIQLVGPASQYWTLRWRQMYKYFSKNKTLSLKVWSVGSCGKKIRISAIKRRHRGGMWDVKM